ncbi:PSD1 and planctomycete cytochrome C domain-containing protein [Limnoglobus roseus]|uniref:Cytochrome c domain-containing protein n=1 Tax=Limnoglobus roseus TaxID=2598579 RepID=A0A5C1ALD7_9BACT|nr:PSD1 and planctomycete cytochrome C domain-containing protein [Limnoglobus roseus]QEL19385.1 hypothetical protein PX52LOC_06456 [Limnoglobus roseus]
MTPRSLLSALGVLLAVTTVRAEKVSYNRDVRPILSDNCFACHGPDRNQRKAKLRLDDRDVAIARKAIVPGKVGESALAARIDSTAADEIMPPPDSHKKLTTAQKDILKQWIAEGAEYEPHWAYIPLKPGVRNQESGVSKSIDQFIRERLAKEKLTPSPEADRVTLIRRLSFDLTGLPPKWDDVQAFVTDRSQQAYEKVVDRLLASPHYGERMALFWLDQVRYADSIGYHSDNPMTVWPYRDYVIKAFNANRPFDRFTTEQLAGDLLPNATQEQQVASAYNRLLQTTQEGGAQAKEYEAKYAADRVRNVGSVWLGVTLGCCQCHDHKYDPFSIQDFYSLAAFFADVQEPAVGDRGPGTRLGTPEQNAALKKQDDALTEAKKKLKAEEAKLLPKQAEWEQAAKDLPANVQAIVKGEKRTAKQAKDLTAYYLAHRPETKALRDEVAKVEGTRNALAAAIPSCLTTQSGPPRTVRVLPRGNWLDDTGEVMKPATPKVLVSTTLTTPRGTRLDLAKWLLARENPLTARVFVNRVWKLFFGAGLARSLEDVGMQGEAPSHPELLDFLALDFQDGWDVKKLVKRIVMSQTYRQSSKPRPEMKDVDTANRLLARQSRFRLDAEFVRDNALSVSCLLADKLGGPSVKPYQPAGYWTALNFPPREWQNDQGEGLYRRGLYTHWQRSFPHPSLLAFDAPSREECAIERSRSNLPQQALTLLNDPTYVEAARSFGERIVRHGGKTPTDRVIWLYQQALSRNPTADEAKVLTEYVTKQLKDYTADEAAAKKFLAIGDKPLPKELPLPELAAWTATARVVLNLHEFISRD